MVDYNETRKRLDSVLSDTKQGDTHHEKSTSRRIQCLHARDSHGQHFGSVWLGWGVKVTATPRILSCCAPPRLLLFPFVLLCPPQFPVRLCSVLCAPMSCPVFLEAKSPGLLAFCSSFDRLSLLLQQACVYPTKPQWNPGRFCP